MSDLDKKLRFNAVPPVGSVRSLQESIVRPDGDPLARRLADNTAGHALTSGDMQRLRNLPRVLVNRLLLLVPPRFQFFEKAGQHVSATELVHRVLAC